MAVPAKDSAEFVWLGIPFDDVPNEYKPSHVPALTDGKMNPFHTLIIVDEMARIEGDMPIGLAGASSVGAPPIIHYVTSAQKQKWLPVLFSQETSFCLGVTEPNAGSDVARIQTSATKSADGTVYTVNGVKKWISGAPSASHMTTAVP
ncbi:Acyl-CoA dehydrogenase [Fusarium austroafricanum]|uniref:Acyl-CoA dehydrogenase n=1 Tax=Fusarium austroafricanum TaxID=2364996 RepID=A0A8H4KF31_9HYPO|nr:Acyl-CoA dehydrogenase [Fusarium austroafricanum]